MNVLVTGANGFVGRALVARLATEREVRPSAAVRPGREAAVSADQVLPERVHGRELGPDSDWSGAVARQDLVVHLAARVHRLKDDAADPLAEFRKVNSAGTLALAEQAASAGVARFVFVSSLKVNGQEGGFSEEDPPAPMDPYAVSKHEAEVGLRTLAARTGMEVVIIRPPLVYGPGAAANFRRLMRAVDRGIPLPFGLVRNRRSLIALGNLVDLIVTCARHPDAAGETFLASDAEDLSTPELIRRLARAMGRPARLVPVPVPALVGCAALLGRGDVARRLVGSLYVRSAKARERLGWHPPVPVDDGLRKAVVGVA